MPMGEKLRRNNKGISGGGGGVPLNLRGSKMLNDAAMYVIYIYMYVSS